MFCVERGEIIHAQCNSLQLLHSSITFIVGSIRILPCYQILATTAAIHLKQLNKMEISVSNKTAELDNFPAFLLFVPLHTVCGGVPFSIWTCAECRQLSTRVENGVERMRNGKLDKLLILFGCSFAVELVRRNVWIDGQWVDISHSLIVNPVPPRSNNEKSYIVCSYAWYTNEVISILEQNSPKQQQQQQRKAFATEYFSNIVRIGWFDVMKLKSAWNKIESLNTITSIQHIARLILLLRTHQQTFSTKLQNK